MKKSTLVLMAFLILTCAFASACGSGKNKLLGRWEAYPGESHSREIEFFNDGTYAGAESGIGSRLNNTWTLEKKRIRIGNESYQIEIKGNQMWLDNYIFIKTR